MNTKEKYMLEALRLFSEKGYGQVGVTEIAEAVGCTTSALYKHFPNKRALFDAILEKSKTEFREKMFDIHGGNVSTEEFKMSLLRMNVEKQVEMMKNLFISLTEDGPARYFRRLVSMEHHEHPELSEIYMEGYIGQLISSFEGIFSIWMDEEKISFEDPAVLAMEYVSPLISMVEIADMDDTKTEECIKMLEKHVITFNRLIALKG